MAGAENKGVCWRPDTVLRVPVITLFSLHKCGVGVPAVIPAVLEESFGA